MTPVWMMKEFWIPVVTGLVGTFVFSVAYYLGLELPTEQIVGIVLGALGTMLGFNNAKSKRDHE